MFDPNRREGHHPAGLARLVLGAAAAGLVLAALPLRGASGADGRVRLPTALDALPFAPGTEGILNGAEGVETRLPGPVTDREQIVVDLGTDGAVDGVQVTQRLELSGLGDFSFKVAGPAHDVVALPDSQNQPGLRRGAVLWQGFSPGTKLLGARMQLFPDVESTRLPVRFGLSMEAEGAPLEPGARRSGAFGLTLTMSNTTAVPISEVTGAADPAELAPALDAIHALLAKRHRPVPGRGGVPGDVAVEGALGTSTVQVEAPFRVSVDLVFPAGTLTGASVDGARLSQAADGSLHVTTKRLLGGGSPLEHTIRVTGRAHGLGLPHLTATAGPAPPRASIVEAPDPGGWAAALASDPTSVEGAAMLTAAMNALWRVARLAQFDAYLGNPDPLGPSTTSYTFRLAPKAPPPTAVAALAGPVGPLGLVILALIVLLLLFVASLAWANA